MFHVFSLRSLSLCALLLTAAEMKGFEYDFLNLHPGPLDGQEGWSQYSAGQHELVSPVVGNSGTEPSVWVGSGEEDTKKGSRARKAAKIDLGEITSFRVEFDVTSDGEARTSVATFGIGNSEAKYFRELPPTGGIHFGAFVIRGHGFDGEVHPAFGPDGKPFRATPAEWYRVRMDWSYSEEYADWISTLSVRSHTSKSQDFTPLFFDKDLRVSTVPLGLKEAKNGLFFNHLGLRVGGHGRLTNISINPNPL